MNCLSDAANFPLCELVADEALSWEPLAADALCAAAPSHEMPAITPDNTNPLMIFFESISSFLLGDISMRSPSRGWERSRENRALAENHGSHFCLQVNEFLMLLAAS